MMSKEPVRGQTSQERSDNSGGIAQDMGAAALAGISGNHKGSGWLGEDRRSRRRLGE